MTLYYDATVDPGGIVRSMRQHDSADLEATAVEALRPIVRSGRWQGPLDVELGLLEVRLPVAVWTRSGADAALTLISPDGAALTVSGLVSGRGTDGMELLHDIAGVESECAPEVIDPEAMMLVDVPRRPLLATRLLSSAAADTLLLETCAEVETLFAAAFFGVLGVGAAGSERWDR